MLKEFCIRLNDALPEDQRQRMRPYLARTIGTVDDGLDQDRQWMCVDWLIREYTPTFLALIPDLQADADRLRALPVILTMDGVHRAMGDLNGAQQRAAAARDAAGDAAGDAAWAAAGDAAWAGAWAAAKAAAGDAARDAARDAAGDAAGDAAAAAAWDAAWAAAGAAAAAAAGPAAGGALAPSVLYLQNTVLSPGGLLDRMLPTEIVRMPVVSEWREVCGV
jgi:hypothetical protein